MKKQRIVVSALAFFLVGWFCCWFFSTQPKTRDAQNKGFQMGVSQGKGQPVWLDDLPAGAYEIGAWMEDGGFWAIVFPMHDGSGAPDSWQLVRVPEGRVAADHGKNLLVVKEGKLALLKE